MKLLRIFTFYLFYLVEVIDAKTHVQRLCQMERRFGNFNTTVRSSASTTARQNNLDQDRMNHIRPLGTRRKRFMAMIPLPVESTTIVPELVRDRSTCPWTMVQDFNETRYPRIMERAVCLHNNGDNSCDTSFLEADRTISSVRNVLDLFQIKTECALVYAKVFVIVECCERGNYIRRREAIDWPVACTCARKRIRSVTPSRG